MDDEMIDRWNSVIGGDDLIFHLGDFTLGKDAQQYFSRLHGRIKILSNIWHHDRRWLPKNFGNSNMNSLTGHPITILSPLYVHKHHDVPPIVLCHYPFSVWDRKHYGSWHLHAHSHGKHIADGFIMDVGVDCHDFAPISLENVEAYMLNKEREDKKEDE